MSQRQHTLKICLFIDALDEHSEHYDKLHSRLLDLLQKLIDAADGSVVRLKLCLSSRPENYFHDALKTCPGFCMQNHTRSDISTYVHGRMRTYLKTRDDLISDIKISEAIYKTCDEVVRRSEGVFLWVKLVTSDLVEGLIDGDSPEQLTDRLSAIPGNGDLHQLYRDILCKLASNHLAEAYVMLQIAYAGKSFLGKLFLLYHLKSLSHVFDPTLANVHQKPER